MRPFRQRVPVAIIVLAIAGGASAADEEALDETPAPAGSAPARGLVELKRQSTGHGTPEQTTKTNLKFDYFPPEGAVSLLRLELPFPDEKTTFVGSVFNPDFGDAKLRVAFRAIDVSGRPATSFVELIFPTARPESQGTGKYQLSAGVRTAFRLSPGSAMGSTARTVSLQVQQVVSFAGDPARKDINQTKFELEWRETWADGHYAKATAKPVVDWVGHGQTGAVLDFEGGWALDRQWTAALLVGGLLWGEGVPSTYKARLEIKVVHRY